MAISKEDKKRLDKIRGRDPRRGSSSSRRVRRGKEIKRDRERRLQEAREKEAREDRERKRVKKTKPKKTIKIVKTKEPEVTKKEPEKKGILGKIAELIKKGFGRAEEQAGGKLPGPLDIATTLGIGGGGVVKAGTQIAGKAGAKLAAKAGLFGGKMRLGAGASGTAAARFGFRNAPGLPKGLTKKGIKKFTVGKSTIQTTFPAGPGIKINTKTRRLTKNLLLKAGFTLAASVYITKEAVESYPFAKFEIAEAMDKIGYARNAAIKEGRQDLVDELNTLQDDILNPEGWDKILSKIPWANIYRAAARNIETAVAATEVYNKLEEDDKLGETDDERWARVRQEQADQEKAAVDYYNEERKKLLQWEEEARDRDMAEDAAFWAAERAKQRKLEEEDRKAIADFWIAYRKRAYDLAMNNRPSNLNFGLL